MDKLNVLLPETSWSRVSQQVAAMDLVTPLLFNHSGDVIDLAGEPSALPIHAAWHNFEIPQAATRHFVKTLTSSETLKFVQTAAAGLDAPFFQQLLSRGITLCNSNAQALSIAEYVVASVLNAFHDFPERKQLQKRKTWQRQPFRELSGSHCLVVGYGNIGSRVVDRLQPFDVKISVLRRQPKPLDCVGYVGTLDDLAGLLPDVDVIILTCALNSETRHLLNSQTLAKLKSNCVLVNVARGALIDESAMIAALSIGKIGYAVLDAFEREPLPEDSPLWVHERVLVSAHTSNFGSGRQRRGDELFLANLATYLGNGDLKNVVRTI